MARGWSTGQGGGARWEDETTGKGVGPRWSLRSLPAQDILLFYEKSFSVLEGDVYILSCEKFWTVSAVKAEQLIV